MNVNFLGQVFCVDADWIQWRAPGVCRNYNRQDAINPAVHDRFRHFMHEVAGRLEFKWNLDVDVMDSGRDEFVSRENLEPIVVVFESS